TFWYGSQKLDEAPLVGDPALPRHRATVTVKLPVDSARYLRATYEHDDRFADSTSEYVQVNVPAGSNAVSHFRVETTLGSSSTAAGNAFDVTVTALNDFDQIVTDYAGTVQLTSDDRKAEFPVAHPFEASDNG